MSSLLKSLFGDHTVGMAPVRSKPVLPEQPKVPARLRVILCASPATRKLFTASQQYDFIPYGRIETDILKSIHQPQVDAILLELEANSQPALEFMDVADKIFPQLPCFVLCDEKMHREVSHHGWQFIVTREGATLPEIEDKFQRALFLFPWLKREALRKALWVLKTMPVEASSHQRILEELKNPQFDLGEIASLIKKDPSLIAQLLKIVNSAAFSRGFPVLNVDEAVSILGASKLQALIASAWAFFCINDQTCEGFHPKDEWSHAVKIAERVRTMCETENIHSKVAEVAILSAMLHDLGKLLLASNLPKDYARIMRRVAAGKETCWQVENELLGFNHAEVAGCLLAIWGVPLPVAEAVIRHHSEGVAENSPAWLIQKAQAEKALDK